MTLDLWGWTPTPAGLLLLVAASAGAGAINAVAGGGSLLSFPAAMAAGLGALEANATNGAAMTPASLAAAWGYRRELREEQARLRLLFLPSLLGGIGGAALLLWTPQRVFDALVPVLLLGASGLLLFQNLRAPAASTDEQPAPHPAGLWFAQLLVSLYGGYFGAGMGIVMLALFERYGGADLHRKNALKTALAVVINGSATLWFVVAGAVRAPAAVVMTAAASLGGFAGAALARRADPRKVRWAVVSWGVLLAVVQARASWFR